MSSIKLKSGAEVLVTDHIAHSPDFNFMAGGKGIDGIYSSYVIRDASLSNFVEFINEHRLRDISFQYGLEIGSPITVVLNQIDSYSSLRSVSFDLLADVDFDIANKRELEFCQIRKLRVVGKFPPGSLKIDKLAKNLDEFEASFDVLADDSLDFTQTRTLRMYDAPNVGAANEVSKYKSLRRLHFDSCAIRDSAKSEKLVDLEILIFAGCKQLQNLAPLARSKSIRHLVVSECPKVRDWNFLLEMPELKSLRITKAIDPSIINKLQNLEFLHIEKPAKKDLVTSFSKGGAARFGRVVNAGLGLLEQDGTLGRVL